MLNKRITKSLRNKIIASILAFIVLLSGGIGYKHQQQQINNLKYQLELKQMQDERATDSSHTTLDIESIENEFNKLCDYKIFSSKINVQHKYYYNRDFVLGLKKKGLLVGTCDVYFEYYVRLSEAEFNIENNKLIITLPIPQLNQSSVHRIKNTLLFTEESKNNIFMNDKDGIELEKSFEDSLDEVALENIEDYYKLSDKQEELKSYAKQEVKGLLSTLGYDRFNIDIKFK